MKLALTLAAGMLAASSFAFAADNSGDTKNQDQSTTGSVNDSKADVQKREDCRDGISGGAPCQEPGTTMEQ